jgi:hypothetical protein
LSPARSSAIIYEAGSQLREAVHALCRVRVDDVEFVPEGVLEAEGPLLIDERTWE